MKGRFSNNWISLDTDQPIWSYFYTVAPLIVIGTKEGDHYDLAPKHMATPLGQSNYFGFICTPRHLTYHNVKSNREFTVSFPFPNQVVMASLAAAPRCEEDDYKKPNIDNIPTLKANGVDALFVRDSYLFLECSLDRIIDDFADYSLISGKIEQAHIHEKAMKVSEIDETELIANAPLLAYLAYGRFAEIKHSFAFPFPKDFQESLA